MMTSSCTPYNKLFFATGGPPSESQSEISSIDSDWSDIKAVALQLGVSNPDELLTERFKIDRQKLENMIKKDASTEGINSAEEFFDNVMKNTTTYISWPCKLKLGAKTKKDPHVRIVGKPEDVHRAKERILASLDSRGGKVIMKMDVSYTDHSYIIGRGGNNIKRIMEKTGTHIHFPDSNRSNPTEKSNQVSLCGTLEGVEKARSLVRSSTPLLISFELPIMSPGKSIPDNDTPYVKEVESKYNVQVIFSNRPKLYSSLVLIKGSENEAARVQEATQLMINLACESFASQVLVHMQLEISPQHHDFVRGKNNLNLISIMERTKTKIIFPDLDDLNIKPIKKSQVTITGTIDGVYKARQQLIGNLPIALIFDYPESSPDTSEIVNLSHKYGVFITLRQKQRQSTIAVVVKGIEKFIDKVYEARHEILKVTTQLLKPEIPSTYFSPKDHDLEPAYKRHLTSLLSKHPESPLTPSFPVTPPTGCYSATYANVTALQKFQTSPPGVCGPNNRYAHQQGSSFNRVPYPSPNANNNNISNSPNNNNYLTVPHITGQITHQNLSPRNVSRSTSGYHSFSSSTNSLEQGYLPSSSSCSTSSCYNNNSIPATSIGHCSPDSTFNCGDTKGRRLSDSGIHCGNSGYPGANLNEYGTPHYDMKRTFTFDAKRVEGFKAMERAPQGELRTPNTNWVGLGLSHTSPAPLETCDDMSWHRGQVPAYNLGATTGMVDTTPSNRRVNLSQHKDIHTLLTSLGLEHYIKTFVLNEIDLDMFSSLTEENLVELGITAFGARKKLLVAIHSLAADAACGAAMPTNNNSPRFSGSAAPGAERRSSSGWL